MFDIGFSELLLIAIVALVVIGPERLPGVARNIGRFTGRLQRYVTDIKRDFNREIEFEEIRRLQQEMETTVQSMQASVRAVEASLQEEVKPREDVLATTLEQAQQNLDHLREQVERLEQGTAPEGENPQTDEVPQPMPRPRKPRVSAKREPKTDLAATPESTEPGATVVATAEDQFRLF